MYHIYSYVVSINVMPAVRSGTKWEKYSSLNNNATPLVYKIFRCVQFGSTCQSCSLL